MSAAPNSKKQSNGDNQRGGGAGQVVELPPIQGQKDHVPLISRGYNPDTEDSNSENNFSRNNRNRKSPDLIYQNKSRSNQKRNDDSSQLSGQTHLRQSKMISEHNFQEHQIQQEQKQYDTYEDSRPTQFKANKQIMLSNKTFLDKQKFNSMINNSSRESIPRFSDQCDSFSRDDLNPNEAEEIDKLRKEIKK